MERGSNYNGKVSMHVMICNYETQTNEYNNHRDFLTIENALRATFSDTSALHKTRDND